MTYQALYRVWRSQRFEDVVGQQAITQTLKNAIRHEKISHAYLFTGPRGTGKTSAAKIFAKAINCPNNQDGEPCNQCDMCRAITAGNQEDVIEIDAASNNGVEEIRFIRDRANYAPTQAAYKVYIIDEVHMLSTGAFNALLKTLEEPKQNVIFILATTEPHKIPATIISRTQRFDFKRIQANDIVEHLTHILNEQGIAYEEGALPIIAHAAQGGMRDALSILDQAISFSDTQITVADALAVTGSLTLEMMDQFLAACAKQDVSEALAQLNAMLASGKETQRLVENLLHYCRDLLIYQQAPQMLMDSAQPLTEQFIALANTLSPEILYAWIAVLNNTQNEIRLTTSPLIYLEVATVKLATDRPMAVISQQSNAADDATVQSLVQEVNRLKQELQQMKQQGVPATVVEQPKKAKPTPSQYRLPKERVFNVLRAATKDHLVNVKNVWEDLLLSLPVTHRAMLRASQPKAASPEGLVIAFDYEIVCQRAANDKELLLMIHNQLSRMVQDYAPDAVMITADSWPMLRKEFLATNQEVSPANDELAQEEGAENVTEQPDEVVTKAQELFGDLAKIVENE